MLLCFWDVTCPHCRETLPVLDSLYRSSWEKMGLKFYAVSLESDGSRQDWLDYLRLNHLEKGWTHVYHSKLAEPGILQPYDIWYYPSFYLVGPDKTFMAKKLQYPQIAEFINSLWSSPSNQR